MRMSVNLLTQFLSPNPSPSTAPFLSAYFMMDPRPINCYNATSLTKFRRMKGDSWIKDDWYLVRCNITALHARGSLIVLQSFTEQVQNIFLKVTEKRQWSTKANQANPFEDINGKSWSRTTVLIVLLIFFWKSLDILSWKKTRAGFCRSSIETEHLWFSLRIKVKLTDWLYSLSSLFLVTTTAHCIDCIPIKASVVP